MSWWRRRDPHVVIWVDRDGKSVTRIDAHDGARYEVWRHSSTGYVVARRG